MTSCLTSSKVPFSGEDGQLRNENHYIAGQLLNKFRNRNWSRRLIKSLSAKNDKFGTVDHHVGSKRRQT